MSSAAASSAWRPLDATPQPDGAFASPSSPEPAAAAALRRAPRLSADSDRDDDLDDHDDDDDAPLLQLHDVAGDGVSQCSGSGSGGLEGEEVYRLGSPRMVPRWGRRGKRTCWRTLPPLPALLCWARRCRGGGDAALMACAGKRPKGCSAYAELRGGDTYSASGRYNLSDVEVLLIRYAHHADVELMAVYSPTMFRQDAHFICRYYAYLVVTLTHHGSI